MFLGRNSFERSFGMLLQSYFLFLFSLNQFLGEEIYLVLGICFLPLTTSRIYQLWVWRNIHQKYGVLSLFGVAFFIVWWKVRNLFRWLMIWQNLAANLLLANSYNSNQYLFIESEFCKIHHWITFFSCIFHVCKIFKR